MLNNSLSFLIKSSITAQVWLFNCPEGCQNILIQNQIKIQHINNIILTNLDIDNISGLMGLLSSLSLSCHIQHINIYGPPGIFEYLQLARKYSQTTFRYSLKIHIINYNKYQLNILHILHAKPQDIYKHTFMYSFIEKERVGRFQLYKANNIYKIEPGSIYAYLKHQKKCIMPDGLIVSGKYFTHEYMIGIKLLYSDKLNAMRKSVESIRKITQLIYN
uniref:Ribonuclease Z n=1 Tax=Galaxaura rugosa TaxID=268570 RepID=A0A1G4NT33_9FLOR|nr:Ribonuclease Z [Galaxaura rugosa]SCW21669.1 Ribonuclease Z [Galaxaura rugosa]